MCVGGGAHLASPMKSTKVQASPMMRAACWPLSKADMAENRCVTGAKGYKQLCDVIVWTPIVHVDGDDR